MSRKNRVTLVVVLAILLWVVGVLLWIKAPEIKLDASLKVALLLSIQLILHGLIAKIQKTPFAYLHWFVAFPISVLLGTVASSYGWIAYILPVFWFVGAGNLKTHLAMILVSMLPEAILWGLIQQNLTLVQMPNKFDPILFDWSYFKEQVTTVIALPMVFGLAFYLSKNRSSQSTNNTESTPVIQSAFAQKAVTQNQTEPQATLPETSRNPIVHVPLMESVTNSKGASPSDLGGILESIVYFMSKNFKSYSALGLLSFDDGRTFVINASNSKSLFFRNDVLVYPGSGILGDSISEPNGFMSGNLKGYQSKVEYYSKGEEVNSVIVSRVLDDDTRKVMGLLVVDSTSINGFRSEDKELLNRFSIVASKLISNARMRRIMENTARQGETIYQISKLLAAENYTRGILGVLIENLRTVFDADRLIICDFVADKNQGRVLKIAGEAGDVKEGLMFEVDDPLCVYGMVFIHKTEYLEAGVLHENRYRFHKNEEKEFAPAEVLVAPLMDESGNILAVIGLESHHVGRFETRSIVLLQTILANASSAITRATLFTKLEKQATIDGLTKIANHRHFQDTFDKYLTRHMQQKKPLALLLMDIDHFKKFNDTYGHPVGDRVLQVVAATISKTIRANDFVARYGGEEFVVILDVDPNSIKMMAERIREAIEAQQIEHESSFLKVTVSIGAACFPLDSTVKKDLIEIADQAMYKSKEGGRNRVTLWSQR